MTWCAKKNWTKSPTAPNKPPKSACWICCCRLRHRPRPALRRAEVAAQREQTQRTREKLRAQLREGKLDQRMVDIEVRERADAVV